MGVTDDDLTVSFTVDGRDVTVGARTVAGDTITLLDALRDQLGIRSVKDGCSPQGQCGCCAVLVDGQTRVSCVTPVTRVAGRQVTTIDGLDDGDEWAACFAAHGASQCGFCTPGIIVRASTLAPERRKDRAAVDRALLAHLCRCTGWQPIVDAIADGPERGDHAAPSSGHVDRAGPQPVSSADAPRAAPSGAGSAPAQQRAHLEGGVAQTVGPDVAHGGGGFADDTAPPGARVAVLAADGTWTVGESVADARARSGKVQGRRSTAPLAWPVDLAPGTWERALQTTWVEPAYLEPDAAWCEPGGEPATPLGNGGAFGGKVASEVGEIARRLADDHQRPVRVLYAREDVVRRGPKRPPMAIALDAAGGGRIRAGHSGEEDPALIVEAVEAGIAASGLDRGSLSIDVVPVAGPPTSVALRAAGWAEVAVVAASLRDAPDTVVAPNGACASALVDDDGVHVTVRCGRPLDDTVLRSYCTGAAHMALGWVRSEGLSLDADGVPVDLTIRSFGILRATDTPPIHVTIEDDDTDPVNGSDAVFGAVAAATWRAAGFPPAWPVVR